MYASKQLLIYDLSFSRNNMQKFIPIAILILMRYHLRNDRDKVIRTEYASLLQSSWISISNPKLFEELHEHLTFICDVRGEGSDVIVGYRDGWLYVWHWATMSEIRSFF
ncbi:hypothetical protein T4D_4815 [Trichinella pseudospiralis]|uniref:Uncharacterized protein n=1 Tax=Trichinella pseudospiralis TaxID=6337 RepID=A0A0V1FIE2_TRIPS|nr:hypothetical protein T4D_4815 [Trichinella pseudospiralis]